MRICIRQMDLQKQRENRWPGQEPAVRMAHVRVNFILACKGKMYFCYRFLQLTKKKSFVLKDVFQAKDEFLIKELRMS